MRDVEAHLLHALENRGRRGRGGNEARNGVLDAALPFVGRIDEQAVHDRRTAIMRDAMAPDEIEDALRLHFAQADVRPRHGREGPRETPAVTVKHRQGPEIHRMRRHAPAQDVRDGVEIRTAVVIDDPFGIARRAGGVVERNRIPFVGRMSPLEFGIAAAQEVLVSDRADPLAACERGVFDVDHERRCPEAAERVFHRSTEFRIGEQHLRFGMLQHECDRCGIEPRVERVEHRARHRDAEMRFVHRRHVGKHRSDGIACPDAPLRERRSKPPAARIDFRPRERAFVAHDRRPIRIDIGAARDERQRRERRVVRRVFLEAHVERGTHALLHWAAAQPHSHRSASALVLMMRILNGHRNVSFAGTPLLRSPRSPARGGSQSPTVPAQTLPPHARSPSLPCRRSPAAAGSPSE